MANLYPDEYNTELWLISTPMSTTLSCDYSLPRWVQHWVMANLYPDEYNTELWLISARLSTTLMANLYPDEYESLAKANRQPQRVQNTNTSGNVASHSA